MSGSATSQRLSSQKQTVPVNIILRDYRQRLRDNTQSLRENLQGIVRLSKLDDEKNLVSQDSTKPPQQVDRCCLLLKDHYETEIRAANMAKAGEALLKLISDLKQFSCLNDFAFVNRTIEETSKACQQSQREVEDKLASLRDEISEDLAKLEQEKTISVLKAVKPAQF